MTEANDAPFVVTMKGGTGYDAPWIVVRGDTATQVTERLRELFSENLGGFVVATADAFAKEWATGREAPATPQQSQAVQNVVQATGGTVISETPTSPAPSNSAPQGQAAGQSVETDRWGGTYEWNHPKAPQTQYGPKVLRRATSQAGKPYAQWLDPRDKKIPSVYKSGGGQNPADLFEAEFARGV